MVSMLVKLGWNRHNSHFYKDIFLNERFSNNAMIPSESVTRLKPMFHNRLLANHLGLIKVVSEKSQSGMRPNNKLSWLKPSACFFLCRSSVESCFCFHPGFLKSGIPDPATIRLDIAAQNSNPIKTLKGALMIICCDCGLQGSWHSRKPWWSR